MDKSPSWQGLPPEATEHTGLLIFFASLACICLALFGERLPVLYLGVPAACTLLLAASMRLLRSRNKRYGFGLDDEARTLNPSGGKAIPFDSIASFHLILYRDRACVHAMVGMLRRRRLLACVARTGPEQEIKQALKERSFAVRVSKNPLNKKTAEIVLLMVMPLLAAVMLYTTIDMYRHVPGAALPAQQLIVEPSESRSKNELHRLGPVSFSVLREYRLLDEQENKAIFHEPRGEVRLVVSIGPPRATMPQNPPLQTAAELVGIGTEAEAALLAVRSRFGLMPARIRATLLKNYDTDTVQIYSVQAGKLNGIMLRGEQAAQGEADLENMPDQVTEVMFPWSNDALVLRVLIISRMPLKTEHISRILPDIHQEK
jgi:hypothetical protein